MALRAVQVEHPLLRHEHVVEDHPRVHFVEAPGQRVVRAVETCQGLTAVDVEPAGRHRHREVDDLVRGQAGAHRREGEVLVCIRR